MKNSEFLAQVVMQLSESRRTRPSSKGNYKDLHNAFMAMAQALPWQPPDVVRRHAVRLATAAMRIALDGCSDIDAHRDQHGLEPLGAKCVEAQDAEEVAHDQTEEAS